VAGNLPSAKAIGEFLFTAIRNLAVALVCDHSFQHFIFTHGQRTKARRRRL
jgi:hypothetical protein